MATGHAANSGVLPENEQYDKRRIPSVRRVVGLSQSPSALVLALAFAQVVFAASGEWVATWGCASQLTEPGNRPPVTLAHSTLQTNAPTGGVALVKVVPMRGGRRLEVRGLAASARCPPGRRFAVRVFGRTTRLEVAPPREVAKLP